MVVAPAVPAKTIPELVAHIKANPGKLTFGYGLATTPHILGETFQQATGIDFVGVPYRGGDRRAPICSAAGSTSTWRRPRTCCPDPRRQGAAARLHRAEAQPGTARRADHDRKRLSAGRLRSGRLAGILAPAGTPAAIVDKINAAVNEALKSAEMKAVLAKLGFEPMMTTPAAVRRRSSRSK